MSPLFWMKHAAKQFILLLFPRVVKQQTHNKNNSKDGCFVLVCLFVVSSASTIASRQIASAPAVRDDLVFTAAPQWKAPLTKCSPPPPPSLSPLYLSIPQVRGRSSATSATPPSRGRTPSTYTSRWCTTATRSTSATCARRPSSRRRCSRATRR